MGVVTPVSAMVGMGAMMVVAAMMVMGGMAVVGPVTALGSVPSRLLGRALLRVKRVAGLRWLAGLSPPGVVVLVISVAMLVAPVPVVPGLPAFLAIFIHLT